MKSIDSGQTWFPINQSLQGSLFVGGMGMHPTSALTFIVGTGTYTELNRGVYGGVFRTTGGGDSWTSVLGPRAPQSPGNPDNSFTAIAYSASHPNIVYTANAVAFYRSADGGTNWTRYAGAGGTNYGPPGVRAGVPIEITVDQDDPNVVFVNNYGGGVFKSTDGARTWQVLGKGYTGADIHKVAVSSQNRNVVLVNGRSGPFKSTNAGDDWTGIYNGANIFGLSEWYSTAIHPTNSSILLLGDEHQGVILRSTDGGNSWTQVFRHPLADASNVQKRHGSKSIAFSPINPQIVYAGLAAGYFFNDDAGAAVIPSFGVYKSTDGGVTWTEKNNGLGSTDKNILGMAVSATDASTVYVGLLGGGVYQTTNGGDQWVNVTNNLPTGDVYSIGLSSSNSNIVHAAQKAPAFINRS